MRNQFAVADLVTAAEAIHTASEGAPLEEQALDLCISLAQKLSEADTEADV